jgi:hypothetical protein
MITVLILMGLTLLLISVAIHERVVSEHKLKEEIRQLQRDDAMLRYRINSLIREIDFHLHQGNELANSYFANCKEVRESWGENYADSFDIWGKR